MRVNRSLTIRTSISLSFAFLTGCSFNFGQVDLSGTANVTADTKIDTTVNASASVTQNGDSAGAAATPGPSVVSTEKPVVKLVVYQNFSVVKKNSTVGFVSNMPQELYSTFFKAIGQNVEVKKIRYTLIGDFVEDSIFFDVRQKFYDQVTVLPSFTNGIAAFSSGNGLFLAREGELTEVNAGTQTYVPASKTLEFLKKKVGLSIKSSNDIVTVGDVPIEGTFPLDGPLFTFCCI